MATPTADSQDSLPDATIRERPSRLVDIVVAVLLLVADAVIVVVATLLFLMVGLGTAQSPQSAARAHSRDVPVLIWLVVWGLPAVAAAGAVVHARLRMPVTAVVQSLFTLACTFLAVIWTRMLLS
ncbi:hypothetical protein GCM10010423_05250 [Streptomyces levis]|uniref:Integral membrane protein n=1 Tax=Streptomyces levis TaxID=285566 RepID=A0ABN3N8Q3_9ACTN